MRPITVIIAALLCLLMIALPATPAVEAQGDPANAFCLETDMSISGVLALEGKGTATITFTGATALPFRNDVLKIVPDDGQGVLSSNEVRIFLTTVSSFLVGKSYWGITIDSVEDFGSASDAQILAHTSGLVDADRNTDDLDASFKFGFSGSGEATSKMIPMAQGAADAFAVALRQAMPDFAYNGTFIVRQRVTTLGVASYTGPALTEGRLTGLLRLRRYTRKCTSALGRPC